MATLNQRSSQLRRGLLFILVFIIVVLSFDTIGRYLSSANNPFLEVPSFYLSPDTFDVGIGVPEIPSVAIAEGSNPAFTIEGVFGSSPDTVLVYSIELPREKLNTVQDATATAATLGFTNTPAKVGSSGLRWQNSNLTRTLSFDTQAQTWEMRTQYFQDTRALQEKTLRTDISFYEGLASGLASSLGFRDSSLRQGNAVAKFARLGNNGLFTNPINGATSADYVSLDLYRVLDLAIVKPENQRPDVLSQFETPSDISGYVYKTDPTRGSLHLITSNRGNPGDQDIYELNFTNLEYNYNYNVVLAKTAEEAWDEVQRGDASLTSLKLRTSDYFAPSQSLNVTKFALDPKLTELGFWEPDKWTGFIYPIYIFRGRAELEDGRTANFVFYADAIKRF